MAQFRFVDEPATTAPQFRFVDETAPTAPPPKKVKLGREGFIESMREVLAEEPWPFAAKVVGGVGTTFDNFAYRLKQMAGNTLTPEEEARVQGNRVFDAASGIPGLLGNVVGGTMITGGPARLAYQAISRAPAAIRAGGGLTGFGATTLGPQAVNTGLIAPSVAASTVGATSAATMEPVLEGETTAGHAGRGAVGGLLGDAGARTLSRLVQPILQSPAVQTLLRHDVVPSPGQAGGQGNFFNWAEQVLASIPGVGHFVRGARDRAGQEFNRAAINQGVPMGERPVHNIGDAGIADLANRTSSAYQRMLGGRTVTPDQQLAQDITTARNSPFLPMSEAGERKFDELMNRLLWQRVPFQNMQVPGTPGVPGTHLALPGQGATTPGSPATGGSVPYMPADLMKSQIIGDIGREADALRRAGNSDDRAVGEALLAARNAVQNWLENAAGIPKSRMMATDAAYTAKSAVEDAAESVRSLARGGQFTPLELLKNARPGSATERLARAGQEVLPNFVPNSGTPERLLAAQVLGLTGAGVNEAYFDVPYLSMLLASPMLMSRPMSRYMLGDLIPGQQAAGGLLRQGAPFAAQSGGLLMVP